MPPTWNNAKVLLCEEKFVPASVALRSSAVSVKSKAVMQQLLALNKAWPQIQAEGGTCEILGRWAGCIAQDRAVVADTLANEARLTPAVRGGDTVNPSGEADGSSASGGNDELNQTNGNPRVVNGQQRVRRPSVVEVVATAKLRGVDHDDDEEKVGTGSVGGSGQEGSAHEVTYDEALETARQQVLAHLSPDSVQELTKADNPDKPTALLAGMLCLLHNMSPPTWATARKLIRRETFGQECVALQPDAVAKRARGLVRNLFRMHDTWGSCQGGPELNRALVQWVGVVVKEKVVLKHMGLAV